VRDVVSIDYLTIERPVSEIPPIREEGETLIIPVVAEEVVVQRQLVLKQEIHLRRGRTTESISHSVTLDREHVVIERLDAEGNLIERSEAPEAGMAPDRSKAS
jgi:stress response protein YsnF